MRRTWVAAITCVLLGIAAFVGMMGARGAATGETRSSRGSARREPSPEQRAQSIVAEMKGNPEWMVGQVCMVGIWGNPRDAGVKKRWEKTKGLVQKYHVGSVLLSESNFSNVDKPRTPSTPEQVATLTYKLQRLAREDGEHPLPLFIAIDQEGDGYPWTRIRNRVTPIPSNLAIGATWSKLFAEKVGEVVGRELSLLGINMLLGPVLDVNSDPHMEAMGVRCFGGSQYAVGRMGSAYIRGVRTGSNGHLAVIAKHWPGHGDCDTLSDYEITSVTRTFEQLARRELVPFLMAINDSNDSDERVQPDGIMPAHAIYTALQGEAQHLPITLDTSQDVVQSFVRKAAEQPLSGDGRRNTGKLSGDARRNTGKLRQSIENAGGWREHGLVVSDALGVEGIIDNYGRGSERFPHADVAVQCLGAGHDIVMLTGPGYGLASEHKQEDTIKGLVELYRRGNGPDSTGSERQFAKHVQKAVLRVVTAKLRLIGERATAIPGPEAAARLVDVVKSDKDSLSQLSDGVWKKAVQWAKPLAVAPPSDDARIVTVEPREVGLYNPERESKNVVAGLLSAKHYQVDRLNEHDVSAWLDPNDETDKAKNARRVIDEADWVIVVLGHRPRRAEERLLEGRARKVDSVEDSLDLVEELNRKYKGAKAKHVAIIACQEPYYPERSHLNAVDGYLITHTKLRDYLELAVGALLTNQETVPLSSPVAIPAVNYRLFGRKDPLLDRWPMPEEPVSLTVLAKAWAWFNRQSAVVRAVAVFLAVLALVLITPHAWVMRLLPVEWPAFGRAVAIAYRLPWVGRLKLFAAYRRRLRGDPALRAAAAEYVDLPFTCPLGVPPAGLRETITAQMSEASYVVVVGEPGSGMSTVLRHLCQEALVGKSSLRGHVPIPVHGIEYKGSIRDLMLRSLGHYGCPCTEAILDTQLEAGGLLILIDGISEVREANLSALEDDLCRLIERYGGNRYLMTSSSYPRLGALQGCEIDLSPLSEEHVIQVLAKHLPPARQHEASLLAQQIGQKLRGTPLTPLSLRMVVDAYARTGTLALSRAELLRGYCGELLKKEVTGMDAGTSDYALRHLAFTLFVERNGQRGCTVSEADNALAAIETDLTSDRGAPLEAHVVRQRLEQARLLTRSGQHVRFCHRIIEDYFAARFVQERLAAGDREPYRKIQSLPTFADVCDILGELQSMPP